MSKSTIAEDFRRKLRLESEGGDEPNRPFEAGKRVLAVDNDPISLAYLETYLTICQYHVTKTSTARTAMDMLKEKMNKFDIVVCDKNVPDMDEYNLFELVGFGKAIPAIMVSSPVELQPIQALQLMNPGAKHKPSSCLIKPHGFGFLKSSCRSHILDSKYGRKLVSKVVEAIYQIGPEKADPQKIMQRVNVGNLTIEDLNAILEPHRLIYMKKLQSPLPW